jgi:mycothiol synthase
MAQVSREHKRLQISHLVEWLQGLLRIENIKAVLGSLKRRLFKLNFLEMRIDLKDKIISSPIWGDYSIRGYSEDLDEQCMSVLNSVGNLGFWNRARFRQSILSKVDDPEQDIFLVCGAGLIVGMTVLHMPTEKHTLPEIGYVGVRPEYRGKKIGYRLLMHILAEAKKRQIPKLFLRTDSFRIAAIKTYINVGFTPYITGDNVRKRWQRVMQQ